MSKNKIPYKKYYDLIEEQLNQFEDSAQMLETIYIWVFVSIMLLSMLGNLIDIAKGTYTFEKKPITAGIGLILNMLLLIGFLLLFVI